MKIVELDGYAANPGDLWYTQELLQRRLLNVQQARKSY